MAKKQQRLCSEIQLFDLCDLDRCGHKDGRYCTKDEMLEKFEAIAEEDDRSADQYLAEEVEEDEEDEDAELGDSYDEFEDDEL